MQHFKTSQGLKIIHHQIVKKINNISLRNKLFLSFVAVVFIPVIIIGGYLTNQLRLFGLEDAEQQASINMERVKERTIEVLKIPIFLSTNLSFDNRLKEIVNTEYETVFDVVSEYWQYNTFQDYLNTFNHEISNIRLFTNNQTLLNNWEIIPVNQTIANKDWYIQAMEGNGVSSWHFINDETNSNQKYLCLVRRIDFPEYNTSGVLVINVNPITLQKILSQESSPTMLVDEKNNIIATNQDNALGKNISEFISSEQVISGKFGTFEDEANRIFVEPIPLANIPNTLRIVTVISNREISANASQFGKIGVIVVSISIGVALFFIYFLSKLLSNRLILLSRQIKQVGKGKFDTPILIDGNDEIGQLSVQLQHMVNNTQKLIQEVHESNTQRSLLEKKQSEIKLKMMASQINPHFLFNALESIRMEAAYKGEKEIANIIKLLGKLMRNSIDIGAGKITLVQELQVIQWYLEIQKFRYDERLHYYLDVDPSSTTMHIPPLTIQPLVENSVIHGLENHNKGGAVWIKINVSSTTLLVEVIDNGIGMTKEKLTFLQSSLREKEDKTGMRIGLRNVDQRLRLIYGAQSGISIDSELNKGTKVSFSIPIRGGSHAESIDR
ncbi:sensor histidine kinase [Gracilibacillus oryzae]|uniref:Sensor histidine kinase n=1 Tax=Gracilibacillus oryzae TaxID=1672701 RepID=A0A7C8GRV3_9BACI|nr:sensor histidine kinase [Gracilibacillus oryzae]KAB8129926.1 sensor histidine kinase [Gracilibacillus oryzae]